MSASRHEWTHLDLVSLRLSCHRGAFGSDVVDVLAPWIGLRWTALVRSSLNRSVESRWWCACCGPHSKSSSGCLPFFPIRPAIDLEHPRRNSYTQHLDFHLLTMYRSLWRRMWTLVHLQSQCWIVTERDFRPAVPALLADLVQRVLDTGCSCLCYWTRRRRLPMGDSECC